MVTPAMVTVQLPAAGMVLPQVLLLGHIVLEAGKVSVPVGPVPVLEIVKTLLALVLPLVMLPKSQLAGDAATIGLVVADYFTISWDLYCIELIYLVKFFAFG